MAPQSTKLNAPAVPAGFLPRPRVGALLDRAADAPLTVLAASAGSGKSVALSYWLAAHHARTAWVSLDEADSDRRRFWTLVLEAFRGAGVEDAVAGLEVHPREPIDILVPELTDALDRLAAPVFLVLDDLHRAGSPELYRDLELLLRHPSHNLRLVLSTRFDPPVGIERMRLAGQVAELRALDLAFTIEETETLFASLGVELTAAETATIWRRAEGWAAGLRLAATSLAGHADPGRFVADFAGDDSTVADYLLAEVLAREPDSTREFLLRASLVDDLPVALATELTGRTDSASLLDQLTHRHALIAPVGARREMYRLHTLFAELLRAQLRFERPGEVAGLHARASRWYARNGQTVPALRHAVASGDDELAAELARECWIAALATGEIAPLRTLIVGLPRERIESDAELALAFAAGLIDAGNGAAVERYLAIADERAAELDAARYQRFAVARATVNLFRGRALGDLEMAREAAQHLLSAESALDAPGDTEAIRALALAGLGIVELWTGAVEEGTRHLERGLAVAGAADLDWVCLLCSSYLALASALSGRLGAAERRVQEVLELAARRGWSRSRPAGVALTILGGVEFLWDRVEDASRTLDRAAVALRTSREPPLLATYGLNRGRVLAAQGRLGEALEAFESALDQLDGWTGSAHLRPLLETETAVTRAALGQHAAAERDLERASANSPGAAIGLARLALASGDPAVARRHLAGALEGGARLFSSHRVEGWVLDAVACDALAEHSLAHDALEHALDAAEPAGMRHAFVAHGAAVRPVLRRQLRLGTAHRSFVDDLLIAVDSRDERHAAPAMLAEQLSEREAAVLRFLPTMMSNQEIASELFVSVNTVKTHLRAIYRKLDASDRRGAVRRGRELELLAP